MLPNVNPSFKNHVLSASELDQLAAPEGSRRGVMCQKEDLNNESHRLRICQ
jgi:hypothetical protein